MKKGIILFIYTMCFIVVFGQKAENKELIKAEIYKTEKAFEKMAAEKGTTEAFYEYTDSLAVINRGNDSLIYGKDNIRHFYSTKNNPNATVNWTPDFIEVSSDGTLGYTYGKYVWKLKQADGSIKESRGIFHTVWKRQKDGSWKYVWD
jgi:ketosteroid isomerase-like protein